MRTAIKVVRELVLAMGLGGDVIYLLLGKKAKAVILLLFADFSVTVTIVQEARTENVLETLCDKSAPYALVIKESATIRIPGSEVVDSDVPVLDQGDRVSADAVVLEAREVQADEALRTDESVPVS